MAPTRCPHCNAYLNWGDNPPKDMLCPSCRQSVDVVPPDKPTLDRVWPSKPPAASRARSFPGSRLAALFRALAILMLVLASVLGLVAVWEMYIRVGRGDALCAVFGRGAQALSCLGYALGFLLIWALLTIAGRSMLALEKLADRQDKP